MNSTFRPNVTQGVSTILSLLTTTTPKLTPNEKEHHVSLTFFFILVIVGICILIIHFLLKMKFHYLPESVAIVFLGALIGFILKMVGKLRQQEEFPPIVFFLVFLPPIIFESGYNMHKGNFFQNLGSILVFAIIGTVVSAVVIGGGLYLCGVANLAYKLSIFESFGFGSLISAVDPVATLAIFKAMDVDPTLYMLVFGESILNDAVSIVLMTTIMNLDRPESRDQPALQLLGKAIGGFLATFLASAAIGIAFALASALILKWFDMRKTPSLEVGIMLVFCYAPYCLCEAIRLSGIMAILFAGIVMSHYTHRNLSPVTQMSVQQIFRTLSFISETIVFAYLGMAIFSFQHRTEPALIAWAIMLCLVGRAINIFPLSFLLNYFREIKITLKNQVVMWFSGLRGAIAFALALHLDGVSRETQEVLVTTALIVVLFTIIGLGGLTLPFIKFINLVSECLYSPSVSPLYSSIDESDSNDTSTTNEDDKEENELFVAPHKFSTRRHASLSKRGTLQRSNGSLNKPLLSSSGNVASDRGRSLSPPFSTRKQYKRHKRPVGINKLIKARNLIRRRDLSPSNVIISKTMEMGDAFDSGNNNMSCFYDTEAEYYNSASRFINSKDRKRIRGGVSRKGFVDSGGGGSGSGSGGKKLRQPGGSSGSGISDSGGSVSATSSVSSLRGFTRLDAKYLFPFFTRCHSQQEVKDAYQLMTNITEQWSRVVRISDKSCDEVNKSPSPEASQNGATTSRTTVGASASATSTKIHIDDDNDVSDTNIKDTRKETRNL